MKLQTFSPPSFIVSCTLFLATCLAFAGSDERRKISAGLFGIDYQDTPELVNYDYNWWGRNPGLYSFYQGGHGGLDIQTLSVAGTKTADETFFAVSRGTVLSQGTDKYKTIAIYDANQDVTTLYLHARRVFDLPDFVEVGDPLGIQGASGADGAEHVHLEIWTERRTSAGNGAKYSVDPEPYLVAYLEEYSPAVRIQNAKFNHWAKNETRNAIQLGIFTNAPFAGAVPDDRAWLNLDRTATRGELVSIIRRAAVAFDPYYFDNLPNVNSPPFFTGDTALANSDHRESVELFARKGFVAVTNPTFNVNGAVTQGEAVLMVWRLFQLGAPSSAGAVEAYKEYRGKLRTVGYKVPKDSDGYLLPNSTQSASSGYSRPLFAALVKDTSPRLFTDATGIVNLTFNQGTQESEREGYNLPAKRALIAKLVINSILFRLTYPATWKTVMDTPRQSLP